VYNHIRLPERKISATVKDTHLGLSFRDSEDSEARASAIFVVLEKKRKKKEPSVNLQNQNFHPNLCVFEKGQKSSRISVQHIIYSTVHQSHVTKKCTENRGV